LHMLGKCSITELHPKLDTFIYGFYFISFGHMPNSGIAGVYGRSIFSLLSNLNMLPIRVVLIYIPSNSV
jgi:hypothetical protein